MTTDVLPIHCAQCRQRIPSQRIHLRLDDDRLVCVRCAETQHAALFPDCPTTWHDGYDHLVLLGDRAAVAGVR